MVNFGIVPLTFVDKQGYADVAQGDVLELDVKGFVRNLCVKNVTKGSEIQVELDLSDREKSMLKAGGKLAAIKAKHTVK
jgi:aconitate hydratase